MSKERCAKLIGSFMEATNICKSIASVGKAKVIDEDEIFSDRLTVLDPILMLEVLNERFILDKNEHTFTIQFMKYDSYVPLCKIELKDLSSSKLNSLLKHMSVSVEAHKYRQEIMQTRLKEYLKNKIKLNDMAIFTVYINDILCIDDLYRSPLCPR